MTSERRKEIALWGRGAARGAALAVLLAGAAEAQSQGSVSDYQLPPAPSSTPKPVEGPVDKDHPVATPTSPAPQASSSPAASATPSPAPITLPTAAAPETQPSAQRPQAVPTQPVQGQPTAAPAPATAVSPEASSAPTADPSATILKPPTEAPVGASPENESSNWWLILGGLALLLVLVGAFLRLRAKPAVPEEMVEVIAAAEEAEEQQQAKEAAPAPTLLTVGPPPQVPSPTPSAKPLPRPAFGESPIELRFAPLTLRLSFVFATLSYRLELANYGASDLRDLRIGGDMISAHASLPNWQQLLLGDGLAPRHEIADLARGQTATLTGELQLALADVIPVQAGAAQMFVPLARFLVESEQGKLANTHIFSLGQPSERSDGGMTPFRIDLGPLTYRQIEQREIDLARWLPVDAERRVG